MQKAWDKLSEECNDFGCHGRRVFLGTSQGIWMKQKPMHDVVLGFELSCNEGNASALLIVMIVFKPLNLRPNSLDQTSFPASPPETGSPTSAARCWGRGPGHTLNKPDRRSGRWQGMLFREFPKSSTPVRPTEASTACCSSLNSMNAYPLWNWEQRHSDKTP